jgi:glyoxylase-like metal-dependent hydrolase (beta-lactamase superfamily II)
MLHPVTSQLYRFEDTRNVYVLMDGDRALLIDCGGGAVRSAISELGVRQIDWALFAYHHRDQCFGAADLAADGVKLAVPKFERPHFGQASDYWQQKRIYDVFKVIGAL